jgi:hypothetical protein
MAAQKTKVKDDQASGVYPRADGLNYGYLLNAIHQYKSPDWYLEIGTNTGDSLRLAHCKSISVDPEFLVDQNVIGAKPALHVFQQTSDDFFASKFVEFMGIGLDFAFLDGLHLYEYTLRDFANAEKLMDPDGVILIHDVIPISYLASRRDWDRQKTTFWTGDVWKVVEILRTYRPDLDVRVLNAKPSGMAVITKLDPKNTVIDDKMDEIREIYDAKDLDAANLAEVTEMLAIERTVPYMAEQGMWQGDVPDAPPES